ncbi:MAG: class I SAM-dependent methyltransferase [Clostridia bacterium]|nr:class I SAM-dependent methyltransferase [Clostridia bacterium]
MEGKAYSALASHYDKLINTCDYEQWSQYVFNKLSIYSKGKVGCDLACGSGYFTRFLKVMGYDVYGVDNSPKMLAKANELSFKEKVIIDYQLQDIKNFKSFKKLDFITVINDGFNYLNGKELKNALKSAYNALNKDGVLLFDISSEFKLKNVLANNLFGEDLDEVTYLWFNTLNEDSVKMELTFFVKKGDVYVREDECHVQYIHKKQDVLSLLNEIGFDVLETSGHLGEDLKDDSQRINFIAKKR